MLAQSFAVVAHDDDDGIAVPAVLVEEGEELAEGGGGVGDLAVVGTAAVAGVIGWGRLVRIVGIVEVHPDEVRPGAVAVQPALGAAHHVAAAALQTLPVWGGGRRSRKVVIEVKAPVEAGCEAG